MSEERDFKGVWIPKEIYNDIRLSALEKIILTEIDSLDMDERGCFASNTYLAKFCQCSEAKITKTITKLNTLGYLEIEPFDGIQRVIHSLVKVAIGCRKVYDTPSDNLRDPLVKNTTPPRKKYDHNNIYNNTGNNISNNTGNNTTNNKDYVLCADKPHKHRFVPPDVLQVQAYCIERANDVDAEKFVDFYTAKNWMIGKNKMTDWKAAVRTWERKQATKVKAEKETEKKTEYSSFMDCLKDLYDEEEDDHG